LIDVKMSARHRRQLSFIFKAVNKA